MGERNPFLFFILYFLYFLCSIISLIVFLWKSKLTNACYWGKRRKSVCVLWHWVGPQTQLAQGIVWTCVFLVCFRTATRDLWLKESSVTAGKSLFERGAEKSVHTGLCSYVVMLCLSLLVLCITNTYTLFKNYNMLNLKFKLLHLWQEKKSMWNGISAWMIIEFGFW